jgi:hypothetical protein
MQKRICFLVGVLLLLTASSHFEGRGADSANPEEPSAPFTFTFGGGSLADFIRAVKEQFDVNLDKEATIEDFHKWTVRVPKLAIPIQAGSRWYTVLDAYTRISQSVNLRLGRWSVNWPDAPRAEAKPVSIIFVPPAQDPARDAVAVKAFSVVELSQEDRDSLMESLYRERDEMSQDWRASSQSTRPTGQIRPHRNGEILLATGNQSFVELASALVAAYKERAETAKKTLPRKP